MKVFITGGTSGIGIELAKRYLEAGDVVGVCGRNIEKLPLELTNNTLFKAYQCDVTDQKRAREVIGEFIQFDPDARSKGLDLVIANAGRSVGRKTITPDFKAAREVINVNIFGVLNTFDPALEQMLKQKSGQLVAISSVAGMVGLPGAGSYSASKAAVLKLCESYALDLKNFGIDVSAIAPGFVDTPLTRKNNHPMPFLMDARKASRLIKKAIDSKKSLYVFPWQMRFVMAMLSRLPQKLYLKIMGFKTFNYASKS